MNRALILGGASCVWLDLAAAERMIGKAWPWTVLAVNDVACHWVRPLDHWCTLHPEKFSYRDRDHPQSTPWEERRKANGHPDGYVKWARRAVEKWADRRADPWGGGSSGLLAVSVALEKLDMDRVVLCGMPMDKRPHFEESETHRGGGVWTSAEGHWKAWSKKKNVEKMRGKVKSMSGRTRELLGAPTREWLLGTESEAAE